MDNLRQRVMMATGKGPIGGSDFGVKSLADTCCHGKGMGSTDPTILSEKQRAAPVKLGQGKLPAQANPDHGPHRWED